MMNYACAFCQSESGKYFESIIICFNRSACRTCCTRSVSGTFQVFVFLSNQLSFSFRLCSKLPRTRDQLSLPESAIFTATISLLFHKKGSSKLLLRRRDTWELLLTMNGRKVKKKKVTIKRTSLPH